MVCPALVLLFAAFRVAGSATRDWLTAPLVLGALSVVAAVVLAIVALVRGRGRIPAIVALVLGVLSVPVGYLAYVMGLLMAKGGALV